MCVYYAHQVLTPPLVACEKATYDYLREQEEIQRRSSVHPPSDNERDDDLFWTQQEDVNAQKGHGVPLTSKSNIALAPDLVTNAPQTS